MVSPLGCYYTMWTKRKPLDFIYPFPDFFSKSPGTLQVLFRLRLPLPTHICCLFNICGGDPLNKARFLLALLLITASVVLTSCTANEAIKENSTDAAFAMNTADGERDTNPRAEASYQPPRGIRVGTLAEVPSATGGVEVDAEGNVYMGDMGPAPDRTGTTVYKITPQGEVSTFATGFLGASGNAFDSKGNFFQSNLRRHSVSKVSPSGEVSTFVEGVIAPVGIAIDDEDNLYVANCGGGSIQKVTAAGESSIYAASELFKCANGITLGPDGNVYVANFRDGHVLKVMPDGSVSIFADVPGGSNGHIIYGNGTFYVVARSAHQIYTLSLSGALELLAGSGARGHQDGAALEATFSLPNDLVLGPSDNVLYLNEVAPTTGTDNHPSVVRMILLDAE